MSDKVCVNESGGRVISLNCEVQFSVLQCGTSDALMFLFFFFFFSIFFFLLLKQRQTEAVIQSWLTQVT